VVEGLEVFADLDLRRRLDLRHRGSLLLNSQEPRNHVDKSDKSWRASKARDQRIVDGSNACHRMAKHEYRPLLQSPQYKWGMFVDLSATELRHHCYRSRRS